MVCVMFVVVAKSSCLPGKLGCGVCRGRGCLYLGVYVFIDGLMSSFKSACSDCRCFVVSCCAEFFLASGYRV